MRDIFLQFFVSVQTRLRDEAAQNLTEYALIIAMIGLGTVAGAKNASAGITVAFNHISSTLNSAM